MVHKKNISSVTVLIIAVLLLILAITLIFYLPKIKSVKRLFAGEHNFVLESFCGVVPGGEVIETIEDEGMCRNACRARCMSENMEFRASGFSLGAPSCNTCNCTCSG